MTGDLEEQNETCELRNVSFEVDQILQTSTQSTESALNNRSYGTLTLFTVMKRTNQSLALPFEGDVYTSESIHIRLMYEINTNK